MPGIRKIQRPLHSILNSTCLLVAHALVAVLLFMQSCVTLRHKDERASYVNNDSTAIFSTHASRPFKYGYAYTKKQCETIFGQYVKDYQIEKGDYIADIGAASGWMEGAFSVLVDSVHFYIQDIDTIFLNKKEFDRVISHYNKVRERPQTNTFQYVIGTGRKTNLPDSMFDKVIFNNTYHEIMNPWKIMEDAVKKIKPEGKIMIRDAFSNRYKTIRHKGCNMTCDKTRNLIRELELVDLHLTGMTEPENSFYNHLVFENNNERSLSFYAEKEKADALIKDLDKFNVDKFSNDAVFTVTTGIYLQEHLNEIHKTYTLENYINTMGYNWITENKFESAINVLNVNVMLYPNSANVYDSLGEAYMKNGQYSLALEHYTKSLSLDADNLNAKEQIKKLKIELNIPE
jgi:tetratricopeptide (TPR) repeat protein